MCLALVPYEPSQTTFEFVRSQVEGELKNGANNIERSAKKFSSHFLCSELSDNFRPKILKQQSNYLFPLSQKISLSIDLIPHKSSQTATEFELLEEERELKAENSNNKENFSIFLKSNDSFTKNTNWEFVCSEERELKDYGAKLVNGHEIAEVLQAQAGFTASTDKKPIIATYGCGPCVALGGYDPTNKFAFMVHFSNADEVEQSSNLLFYNISKLAKQKIETPIQLHLKGGYKGSRVSEETVKAIKIWMMQRKDLPMEIASEDILSDKIIFGGKSLSIDSRTGKVSEYDPKTNPHSKRISDEDALAALKSAFVPCIRLAYTPNS